MKFWTAFAAWGLVFSSGACGDDRHTDFPPSLISATGASSIMVSILEGGVAHISARATDPEGEPLTYVPSAPAHGMVTGDGSELDYTPAIRYSGIDTFSIAISDGMNTTTVPVTITIKAVDVAPVAHDGTATTNENQGVSIQLNATDPDGPSLTYELADPPGHGTVTLSGTHAIYTPSTHYHGEDSFTYRATDGILPSNLATITITVANVVTCGDGFRDGAEQCDDGNTNNTDACLNNCMSATCGDGVVEAGVEQCDDANANNTDACLTTCHTATCGDGFTQAGVEQCDDGNHSNTDACLNTCLTATCGDGFTQTGVEACDDGNQIDTDACRNTCMAAGCGDGVVGPGEQCDDGNLSNNDSCLNTCVTASCGDGFVRTGFEQCDDANSSNNDGCLDTCVQATCGDGFVQLGVEQCDDANQSNTDSCSNTCTAAACGDGFVQAGVEQCDDGNTSNNDACLDTCANATCGDGFVRIGFEQCDDANQSNTDACLDTCTQATCGDGFVQTGVEQCDDGNQSNTDACLDSCAIATCGDGFIQTGVEQCDDGNQNNTDSCANSCASATCGDGFVQAGVEQCDDGNTSNTDGCLNTCITATCGDGFTGPGEQCDDGNQVDGDACKNDCTLPPVNLCGNHVTDPGEECDDGNQLDGDGCGHSCKIERCGDGLTQFTRGEQCDDGNTVNGDGCDATCQTEPFVTTVPVRINTGTSCTTATANAARKVSVDGSGTLYAVMQCGASALVVTSTTRGQSFSTPIDLSADLPNAPVTVSQTSVASSSSGTAHVAIMLNTGEVYLRTTHDGGATWSAATQVGTTTSTSAGLSLFAFNDDIYVGYSISGGVGISINHTNGTGSFTSTSVAMSIAYFDVLYDVVQGQVVVAADTPGFHIRISNDAAVSFASEVNPPGQEYYSDWGIGNGSIFAVGVNLGSSGNGTSMFVIPTSAPTTSTQVFGLPSVSTAQTRTVTGDIAGNAYVGSQLDGGGVQLDYLPAGASAFGTPRTISATGGSPTVTALPGGQGAAVVYTDSGNVYATIQAYP